MTREENLHWLNQEIRTWENECQSKHPIKEALHAARKALEQEQDKPMVEIDLYSVIKQKYIEREVLDKIRVEISKTWHTHPQSRYEEGLKDQALRDIKIIDRYTAESEET